MVEQLAAMPGYEAYKDSGVEWLGKIPAHWELSKLGSCLKPVSVKNRSDLPLLSITREKGVIQRNIEDPDENHNYIPDDLSNYKVLERGQFGMNKMKAWQGSYGVSDHTGIVSPAYFIFAFTKEIDSKFFHLAIRSGLYISYFGSASDGVRIGQWDLSKPRMKEIPFLIPPIPEQTIIATFLDQKTAQIDQAVAIKEKQIALLKERKQILIQNTVTRGLNPDAPMRDSGVEWIGEIPAHWEVVRFRYCCTVASGQVDPRKEPFSSMVLIAPNHIESATGKLFSIETAAAQGADSGKYQVTKGDLVYSKIRPALRKACISPVDGLCSADMYVLRPKSDFNSIYLLHYILTDAFTLPALDAAMRVAMPKVNREALGDFPILTPLKEEQAAIVAHIETESAKIDQAISIQQQQIDKLKEYKATLINSAVTGKIRVSMPVEGKKFV